jgi:hypothetical protein
MTVMGIYLRGTVSNLVGTGQVITDVLWGTRSLLDIDLVKSESATRRLCRTINVDDRFFTSNRAM